MGRLRIELDLSGLDLREVEDVVEHRQESRPRPLDQLQEAALLGAEIVAVEEEVGEAEDRVQRRPDLVAHRGQEVGLGLARLLRRREQPFGALLGAAQLDRLRLALRDIADRDEHGRLALVLGQLNTASTQIQEPSLRLRRCVSVASGRSGPSPA